MKHKKTDGGTMYIQEGIRKFNDALKTPTKNVLHKQCDNDIRQHRAEGRGLIRETKKKVKYIIQQQTTEDKRRQHRVEGELFAKVVYQIIQSSIKKEKHDNLQYKNQIIHYLYRGSKHGFCRLYKETKKIIKMTAFHRTQTNNRNMHI